MTKKPKKDKEIKAPDPSAGVLETLPAPAPPSTTAKTPAPSVSSTTQSKSKPPPFATPIEGGKPRLPLRDTLYRVIFEADTRAGKLFDIFLLLTIFLSVLIVALESVQDLNQKYGKIFIILEWTLTIFFTIEYLLRLFCVHRPWRYATSFYGVIDLLAILPVYLSLFLGGGQSLMIVRALRLMRIFRILKLGHFLTEGHLLLVALRASRVKITVFLSFVLIVICIMGSLMYLVEGGSGGGFTSIPRSVYWAIVTLTTVGYGDIAPKTPLGQFLASLLMITGYAVIAVPTGIVSSELIKGSHKVIGTNTRCCRQCTAEGHDDDATFCKYCGASLPPPAAF